MFHRGFFYSQDVRVQLIIQKTLKRDFWDSYLVLKRFNKHQSVADFDSDDVTMIS